MINKLLFFFLFLFVVSHHLKCNKGEVDYYKYDGKITGLGKGKEHITISGVIGMSCGGITRIPNSTFDHLVQVLTFTKVKLIHDGEHPAKVKYDTEFDKPVTFIQKKDGEIAHIIYEKEEKPTYINLKKSIVTNFNIRLKGTRHVEKSPLGDVEYDYEKAVTKKGDIVILKKARNVLKPADKKQKKRDAKVKHTSYVQVSKTGKIHKIYSEHGANVGKPSAKSHYLYKNKQSQLYQHQHPDDFKDNDAANKAFNFGSVQTLTLVGTGKFDEKQTN